MKLKPGYKQTEVGVIPEEWEVKSLKEFATVKGGKRLPLGRTLTDKQTTHPYIRVTDMRPGGINMSDIKYVPDDIFPVIQNYCISTRDLFISVAGTLGIVGKVPDQLDNANLTENADKITNLKCDQNFLLYSLLSDRIQDIIDSVRTVGAQPKLAIYQIEDFLIPLPATKSEQRAIAEALRDVDGLLAGLENLIAKKRALKQATMQQLLTGQTRLPGFRGEWEVKTLGYLSEHKKALFNDGDWIEAQFLTDNGVRLIQTGNIGEGIFIDKESKKYISTESFQKLKCKELQVGDILICRLAEPAGRACILPDIGESRLITSVDVTIFRPPTSIADRRFLINIFNTQQWFEAVNERCGGSTRTRIARGQLSKLQINLPPLPEQRAIAEILSDMDAEIAALEARREKTVGVKQGMMQELLTGTTRLL